MVVEAIRSILVGLDGDHLADDALSVSMELADAFGARLDLLHAVDVHPLMRAQGRASTWAKASEEALEEARARIEGRLALTLEHPRLAELPVSDYLTVVPGRPATALLEFSERHATDLIVLGRHHKRALFDFGGTARALLARSDCPVWLQPCERRAIGRILAAVDLSTTAEHVFAYAKLLARVLGARVDVLHCPPLPVAGERPGLPSLAQPAREDELAEFERRVHAFAWDSVPVDTLFVDGDPATEVLARQADADLLVVGAQGSTHLAQAMLGSQSYRILKHAERPIVAVPQRRPALVEERPSRPRSRKRPTRRLVERRP
jgi:nucleotide-binding universal stress UspA family protein